MCILHTHALQRNSFSNDACDMYIFKINHLVKDYEFLITEKFLKKCNINNIHGVL